MMEGEAAAPGEWIRSERAARMTDQQYAQYDRGNHQTHQSEHPSSLGTGSSMLKMT